MPFFLCSLLAPVRVSGKRGIRSIKPVPGRPVVLPVYWSEGSCQAIVVLDGDKVSVVVPRGSQVDRPDAKAELLTALKAKNAGVLAVRSVFVSAVSGAADLELFAMWVFVQLATRSVATLPDVVMPGQVRGLVCFVVLLFALPH